jgi:hypothetical protein
MILRCRYGGTVGCNGLFGSYLHPPQHVRTSSSERQHAGCHGLQSSSQIFSATHSPTSGSPSIPASRMTVWTGHGPSRSPPQPKPVVMSNIKQPLTMVVRIRFRSVVVCRTIYSPARDNLIPAGGASPSLRHRVAGAGDSAVLAVPSRFANPPPRWIVPIPSAVTRCRLAGRAGCGSDLIGHALPPIVVRWHSVVGLEGAGPRSAGPRRHHGPPIFGVGAVGGEQPEAE